jgi:serine/threonine protein kinase
MSVGLLLGGRYELRATLGRGGFGAVWRAYDRTLGREVAVKIIKFDEMGPLGAADLRSRFIREAQAVAALNHPNVVTAHDFGVEDDTAYLVMELISGGSLEGEQGERRKREAGPFELADVLAIGAQICSGLAAAHTAGLVHRDLKPANVMRTAAGQVKIVDFGIARDADQSRLTQSGVYLGTLRYTSPEQMDGGAIDGRSDLYSLGCVLFELLTERSPFEAHTPPQWIAAHQFGQPKTLSSVRPDTPAELNALVTELLAKKPAQRPATADAVRHRLERIKAGSVRGSARVAPRTQLDTPRPMSPGPPPAPWQPRKPAGYPPYSGPYSGPYRPPVAYPYPAYPQGLMPDGPSSRPLTVSIATILMLGSAALSLSIGIATLVGRRAISSDWHEQYDGLVSASGRSALGVGYGIAFTAIGVQLALAVALAYPVYRGGRQARTLAWIYIGLTALCCIGTGAVPYLFTPTSGDIAAGQTGRLSGANDRFIDGYPSWLHVWTISIGVIGAIALITAAILLGTPSANRFFRVSRFGVPMPPLMR